MNHRHLWRFEALNYPKEIPPRAINGSDLRIDAFVVLISSDKSFKSFSIETPKSLLLIYQKGTFLTYEEFFLNNVYLNGAPAWKSKEGDFISRSSDSEKWQIGEPPLKYTESEAEYSSPFEEGISWDTSMLEDIENILVTKDGKILFLLYCNLHGFHTTRNVRNHQDFRKCWKKSGKMSGTLNFYQYIRYCQEFKFCRAIFQVTHILLSSSDYKQFHLHLLK